MSMKNIVNSFLIVAFGFSSYLYGEGSIMIYNYSFYKARAITYTQNTEQEKLPQSEDGAYTKLAYSIGHAPLNEDGSLKIHPVNDNYVAGSNIPLGVVGECSFCDEGDANGCSLKYLRINIFDKGGKKMADKIFRCQAGEGVTPILYIYSHMNAQGQYVPNAGGSVYLWDAQHPLNNPSVQTFYATAAENGL